MFSIHDTVRPMNVAPPFCFHVALVVFVSGLSGNEEPPAMIRPASRSGAIRHAYGSRRASALCGEPDWHELVPDAEVTCPACWRAMGERAVPAHGGRGPCGRPWKCPMPSGRGRTRSRIHVLRKGNHPRRMTDVLARVESFLQCDARHAVIKDGAIFNRRSSARFSPLPASFFSYESFFRNLPSSPAFAQRVHMPGPGSWRPSFDA